MIVRGDAFFHEWEGALPFFGMSSSRILRLELLEQHRRVVADARVRERGELVRIGAAEEHRDELCLVFGRDREDADAVVYELVVGNL